MILVILGSCESSGIVTLAQRSASSQFSKMSASSMSAADPRYWSQSSCCLKPRVELAGASTPFSVRMVTATAYDGKFAASLLATTTCHSLFASLCLPIRPALADAFQTPRDVSADGRQRVGLWDAVLTAHPSR
jgi:hypothetical protein